MATYAAYIYKDSDSNAWINTSSNVFKTGYNDLVRVSQLAQIWGIYVGSELRQIYGFGSAVKSDLIRLF